MPPSRIAAWLDSAALFNTSCGAVIFSLIKQRFPDTDPVEKILDWTFDLAETRVVGIETTNALGIPNFGDAEMFVLENVLNSKTDAEIIQAFAAENPGSDVVEAIAKVRGAVIFRPLLK